MVSLLIYLARVVAIIVRIRIAIDCTPSEVALVLRFSGGRSCFDCGSSLILNGLLIMVIA